MDTVIPIVQQFEWENEELKEFIDRLIQLYQEIDNTQALETRYERIFNHCANPKFILDIDDGLERMYECIKTDKEVTKSYFPESWNGRSLDLTFRPMPIDEFMVTVIIAAFLASLKVDYCDLTFSKEHHWYSLSESTETLSRNGILKSRLVLRL